MKQNHTQTDQLKKAINSKLEAIQILTTGKARQLAEEIMLEDLPELCKLCQKERENSENHKKNDNQT